MKAQQELKLARDMKNSKKGAYKYVGSKRKIWAYCSVCQSQMLLSPKWKYKKQRQSVLLFPWSLLARVLSGPFVWWQNLEE